ncbi:MAG: amidohydrolase family protein [Verrucomicrobia bacterium]|nr:amidohydrolase family protein [Verrucomicrobiota bacterium]
MPPTPEPQIIRCRCLLPVSSPPIFDGGMVVASGLIQDIGPWNHVRQLYTGTHMDLGESVLMPGLINAHCHLEYTQMAGKLDPPASFTDWIRKMIDLKKSWSPGDFQHSWQTGYNQSTASGTTTIADNLSQPIQLSREQLSQGARLMALFEWIQLEGIPWTSEQLQDKGFLCQSTDLASGLISGLAPHAPYTTTPILWRFIQEHPELSKRPISVHLAESQEEMDLFQKHSGPMHDWFSSIGHLPNWGTGSPIQLLESKGAIRNGTIIIHANGLDDSDLAILAHHNIGIVHCPRSHHYFQHPPFQLEKCLNHNIPVALGTDSLASIRPDQHPQSLSMFHEMQSLLKSFPTLRPQMAIEMTTLTAAKVLGLDSTIGSLAPGKQADWISLPCKGTERDLHEAIIHTKIPPQKVVIGGKTVLEKQI